MGTYSRRVNNFVTQQKGNIAHRFGGELVFHHPGISRRAVSGLSWFNIKTRLEQRLPGYGVCAVCPLWRPLGATVFAPQWYTCRDGGRHATFARCAGQFGVGRKHYFLFQFLWFCGAACTVLFSHVAHSQPASAQPRTQHLSIHEILSSRK